MRLVVTRSNLAKVLAEYQPSGSSGRAAFGLAAIALVLWDLLALADLGRGPTAFLASELLSWVSMSPLAATAWIAVLVDSALLWVGISMVRSSRWFALFRRRLWETVTHVPRLLQSRPTRATALVWLPGVVCAVYVSAMLSSGLAELAGGPIQGLLLAIGPGLAVGALAVGVASTVRLQRFPVAGGTGLAVLVLLVIALTSPPLADLFATVRADTTARFVRWSIGAFVVVVALVLFLAFETDEESLNLVLQWDPPGPGDSAGAFEHRPLIQVSFRRAILHIDGQGRPILLVTKTLGDPCYVVSRPPPLDESQPIDLSQTGFTIWDLQEVSASILGAGRSAAAPMLVGDSQGLLQVEVTPYAQPTTAKLPPGLRISEETFTYLKDHVFLPGALAPQMASAVTAAMRELTSEGLGAGHGGLGGDRLAEMAGSWETDYHKLDLVRTADSLQSTNVLFRTPGFMNTLRAKEQLAEEIIQRIGNDAAQLLVLENRLKSVADDLPRRVEASFFRGIEALLSTLDEEQRRSVRAVLGLFNVTAGARPGRLDGLATMRERARSVQAKIATDRKEAELKVETSQKEIDDFMKTLMATSMLSPPQRKFLEAWSQQLALPVPPSPPPLTDGGGPRPNRRRF